MSLFSIEDVNDKTPIFKKKTYEGFMNEDLSRLRSSLQVEAVDLDKSGTQNSDVRYEIIKVCHGKTIGVFTFPQGNYENKFKIDEESGLISVLEPLQKRDGRTGEL